MVWCVFSFPCFLRKFHLIIDQNSVLLASFFFLLIVCVFIENQADEALRLVHAAADHDKIRVEHMKHVADLRAGLEKLEAANG